jgi:hypothetical protein
MASPGGDPAPTPTSAKALAFYLPQFHPIPENDEWWGEGFTEWSNVTAARPLYPGHYQPHVPGELGYYDLRDPEVRAAQAEMARQHGITGFVYYHYWFQGKRLLERPFDEVLASGAPDFPFALCWANEEWTRHWDGRSGEVLMPQGYSHADDLAHLRWLARAFGDPRYVTIDGRPLMLVYRAGLIPDPRRMTDTWRAEAQRLGFPDLYLCLVDGWGRPPGGPAALGFDATVGFVPFNGPRLRAPAERSGAHRIIDYVAAYEERLAEPAPPWKHFPAVMVGWDNTARYSQSATVFEGATPEQYRRWLQRTVDSLSGVRDEENYLFLLAWNEWAEGNHLEPDRRHGRAFLEATRSVLLGSPSPGPAPGSDSNARPVATVGPSARANGAPGPPPATMPAGPWLLVLGMHRSGTSAVTGALGALGFNTPGPADRMDWPQSNPEHWESSALAVYDEELLARAGGSWDAPPGLPPDDQSDPTPGRLAEAVAAARVAYQEEGPLVWKDPRLCLLLPFWRGVLPAPLAAVLVWRSPLAVARSLQARDGMALGTGVALWERYNRDALEHLVGVDTYVCRYESVLEDPQASFSALGDWLAALPQFSHHADRWESKSAGTSISHAASGRSTGVDPDDGLLLAQHHELVERLTDLEGGHRPLGPTPLTGESGWTTEILAARRGSRTRELDKLEARRRALEQELEDTRRSVEQLRGSRAWRVTEPLRALRSRLGG